MKRLSEKELDTIAGGLQPIAIPLIVGIIFSTCVFTYKLYLMSKKQGYPYKDNAIIWG